jgi:signal transduction histidine kinase
MDDIAKRLRGDTGRLAATYLVIIMGLTIVFSGVIFAISSSQLDRPLPRGPMVQQFPGSDLQALFDQRANEARAELFASLLLFNIVVLIGGSAFSYFLARRTLAPIEAAMEAQSRFVSDASHELRTPLTALQVSNEVALRKKKLTLTGAKELIGHNLTEVLKLRAISESLLGLARQDTADTSHQDVVASDLVADVIKTMTPLADERHMKLVSDVASTSVSANRAAVSQVVSIFVDNALKYAPEASRVTVSGTQVANEYQVSVHDDGPGIPVRHQQDIFKRFYRIDESRSSQHTQGSGLGLSIAQAIADRQGYRVSLKASEHGGNTFTLHIPVS